jgi:hypothetical protein
LAQAEMVEAATTFFAVVVLDLMAVVVVVAVDLCTKTILLLRQEPQYLFL